MSTISYKQELLRKTIHLSSLWIPIAYHITDKEFMLWLTGVVMAIILFADISRHYIPLTGRLFNRLFGNMLRDHEKQGITLSGASYTLIAGFIAIILFEKPVAIAAISILVISDALAAVVGRKFGSIKLNYGKSLQGSLAFLFSALAINYIVGELYGTPHNYYVAVIAASISATFTELFSKRFKLDDNITIPLSFGFVMQGLL
jgi:dolichol kinase